MTWEELKEEAKKMGYKFGSWLHKEWVAKDGLSFDKYGYIYYCTETLSRDRTPDQMLAIMKALQ